MNQIKNVLLLTSLLVPPAAFAMPDWDGIYLCTTKSNVQKYVALKSVDTQLHLIGMTTELDGISDGLECGNERHDPKPGAKAGVSIEVTCDDKSLSEALTLFVGGRKATIKMSVTKTSPTTVDISISKFQESDNFKNNQEVVLHCAKD